MKRLLYSPRMVALTGLLILAGCDDGDFSSSDIISIIYAVADAVIEILRYVD